MLSVKQGDIKYYFLSNWYNSTKDWMPVSWTIAEHSTPLGQWLGKEWQRLVKKKWK